MCKIFPSCRSEAADSSQLILILELLTPTVCSSESRTVTSFQHWQYWAVRSCNWVDEMTKACRLTFDLLSVGCHVFDPGRERRRVCITDVVEAPLGCRCAPTWFNGSNMNKCLISRISHSHDLRQYFSLLLWAEVTVSCVQKEHIRPSFQLFLIWIWSHCWRVWLSEHVAETGAEQDLSWQTDRRPSCRWITATQRYSQPSNTQRKSKTASDETYKLHFKSFTPSKNQS